MPRVAVISDIHGNMPALEAVLADLARQAPDEVLVGGDMVGRGPQGSAVVRRIAGLGWPVIRGNHEEYVLGFRRGEIPDAWRHADEWAASRWMAAELGDEEAELIGRLPFSTTSRLDPGLRLVHGTPTTTREGIGPWLSDSRLGEHLAEIDEALLVCAHTHRPLHRELPDGTVVNVGSVGLPFNGDRRAQYALFERTGRSGPWRVELRQVDYDVEETLAIYESTGFLAEGGITARLLRLELEHATPLLVPFLKWSEARGVAPDETDLEAFLRFHRPDEPLSAFFRRLQAL